MVINDGKLFERRVTNFLNFLVQGRAMDSLFLGSLPTQDILRFYDSNLKLQLCVWIVEGEISHRS